MDSGKKVLTDKYMALVLFFIGFVLYFISLSISSSTYDKFLSTAATLPRVVAAGIMLFSVIFFIQSIKKDRMNKGCISGVFEQLKEDSTVYLMFAAALVYVFLFKRLGYISSTMIFTLGACFLLGRKKIKWYVILIIALSISIGSYFFFYYLLDVSLPSGIFI